MRFGDEAVYALLDLLNAAAVPYMLVGSFSSNAYGEARATEGADFVVDIDEKLRKSIDTIASATRKCSCPAPLRS